jgi:predicted component of type VI protein secretion system
VTLVRNYTGDELAWRVALVLRRKEVPNLMLDGALRLGWTTWLGKGQGQENIRDLTLDTDRYINLTVA